MRSRESLPFEFVAVTAIVTSPCCCGARPVIQPVLESIDTPAGSPVAENVSGLAPIAVAQYRIGLPGRTPKIVVPVIFGSGPGFGVRISLPQIVPS